MKFAKAFHSATNSSDTFTYKLLFIGSTQYNICLGPGDCFGSIAPNTCSNSTHPTFPYPHNQFENYTNVGQEIVDRDRSVIHFVGLTPFGYDSDQYFFTEDQENKYPG